MKTYNVEYKLTSESYGWRQLDVQASSFSSALSKLKLRLNADRGGALGEAITVTIERVK